MKIIADYTVLDVTKKKWVYCFKCILKLKLNQHEHTSVNYDNWETNLSMIEVH